MTSDDPVEILLVDDNPSDVELTIHSLRRHRLTNAIQVAGGGEEALDFIFRPAGYRGRPPGALPRLILLDLKLPKVDGLEVLKAIKRRFAHECDSSRDPDFVEGAQGSHPEL